MTYREGSPDFSVARRFRARGDAFSFTREPSHYVAHLVANAERVVDLFLALTAHLPPAVDVVLGDARSRRSWRGERLALPDVHAALARIRGPIAACGGVEVALFTSEDQLTLDPRLELFIYARTDRWAYLLAGMGLEERATVVGRGWTPGMGGPNFPPRATAELRQALAGVVDALRLVPA